MGCDIHPYLEAKIEGRWVPAGEVGGTYIWHGDGETYTISNTIQLDFGRSYHDFGILAGVRGDGCAIEPRGYPSDMSRELQFLAKDGDYHTPSYWYFGELLEHQHNFNNMKYIIKIMTDLVERYNLKHDELRLVFAFDN